MFIAIKMITRSDLLRTPISVIRDLPKDKSTGIYPIREGVYALEVMETLWRFLKDLSYYPDYTVNIKEFFGITKYDDYFALTGNCHYLSSSVRNNTVSVEILKNITIFKVSFRIWKQTERFYIEIDHIRHADLTETIQFNTFTMSQFSEIFDYNNYKSVYAHPNLFGKSLKIPVEMMFSEEELKSEDEHTREQFVILISHLNHPSMAIREGARTQLYKFLGRITNNQRKPTIPKDIVNYIFLNLTETSGLECDIFTEIANRMIHIDNSAYSVEYLKEFLEVIAKRMENPTKLLDIFVILSSNPDFIAELSKHHLLNHRLFDRIGLRYDPLSIWSRNKFVSTVSTRLILWNIEVGIKRLRAQIPSDPDYKLYSSNSPSKSNSDEGIYGTIELKEIQRPGDYKIRRSSLNGTGYSNATGRVRRCLAVEYWRGESMRPFKTLLEWNWTDEVWSVFGSDLTFKSIKDFVASDEVVFKRCKS